MAREYGLPPGTALRVTIGERAVDPAKPLEKKPALQFTLSGMDSNMAVDALSDIVAAGVEEIRQSENALREKRQEAIAAQTQHVGKKLARKISMTQRAVDSGTVIAESLDIEIGELEKDVEFFTNTWREYHRYRDSARDVIAALQALVERSSESLAGLKDEAKLARAELARPLEEIKVLEEVLAELRADEARIGNIGEWIESPLLVRELPKKTVSPQFRGGATLVAMGALGLFFGCLAALSWDAYRRRRRGRESMAERGKDDVVEAGAV